MNNKFWYYISTKANWDPVKTIFLCAPKQYLLNPKTAEDFALKTGWVDQVEEDGGILIVPYTSDWSLENSSLIKELYNEYRNSFVAVDGISTPGRNGILWTWETIIYLVGYDDGADFAIKSIVNNPNMFAASALINSNNADLTGFDNLSSHWFVPNPSKDYCATNKDVSSVVWFFNKYDQKFVDYLNDNKAIIDNVEPIKIVNDIDGYSKEASRYIMNELFNHVMRWKNSPDGQLKYKTSKKEFYLKESKYKYHDIVDYSYFVYIPEGMNLEKMSVVFSIHGRGEPAWIFAEKNGWEELADETKEFIVVLPNSPYNAWFIDRDKEAIKTIIDDLKKNYSINEERVYLTGFSNGAIFTNQQMTTYPELFAAASPWNGPGIEACKKITIGGYYYNPNFLESGYEMPVNIFVGDSDSKASSYREDELDYLLKANKLSKDTEVILDETNYYFKDNGYKESDRLYTRSFKDENGMTKLCLTIMKNMPHGAIADEARAAWDFMKKFKRENNNRKVTIIK